MEYAQVPGVAPAGAKTGDKTGGPPTAIQVNATGAAAPAAGGATKVGTFLHEFVHGLLQVCAVALAKKPRQAGDMVLLWPSRKARASACPVIPVNLARTSQPCQDLPDCQILHHAAFRRGRTSSAGAVIAKTSQIGRYWKISPQSR